VRLRNIGQHFAERRPHEGDAEVSEWLAEVMRRIEDIGPAAVTPLGAADQQR
jgi:hypothetical protein